MKEKKCDYDKHTNIFITKEYCNIKTGETIIPKWWMFSVGYKFHWFCGVCGQEVEPMYKEIHNETIAP